MRLSFGLLCRLMLVGAVFIALPLLRAGEPPKGQEWSVVSTPFIPINITARGSTIWVCGADEMILSSKDGGATWQTRHESHDGELLSNISFVDEKIGFATGSGGVLLATTDGGESWKRRLAPGSLRAISFADAMTAMAVIDDGASVDQTPPSDRAKPISGTVKVTQDAGAHWAGIEAGTSEEMRAYSQTLSVAALDGQHMLMLRRHPEVEDVFVVTSDGGKTWKIVRPRNDSTNRELPRMVFVHDGEYWAFGTELVHREKGGGYSVALTMHSKDGQTWTHGAAGPHDIDTCNAQGCFMWDGVVENLYGEKEQFWAMPQDGSMSEKWAIAGGVGCTVKDGSLKCSQARVTEKPLDRPEAPGGMIFFNAKGDELAEGCVVCNVHEIVPEKAGPPSMQQFHALLKVRRDGTVASVAVDFPSQQLSDKIAGQLSKWLMEPAHKGSETVEAQIDVSLTLMCSGFPDRPETYRCTLHGASQFGGVPVRHVTSGPIPPH